MHEVYTTMNPGITFSNVVDSFATFGCSIQEFQEALEKLNAALINLQNRVDVIETELRPVLDETTEIPKQKSDLEIFEPIIPDIDFLKFCEDNPFLIDFI